MAVEVAKLIEIEKIILISSAKTTQEIPYYYRLAGRLKIHKLIPVQFMKRSNIFSNWFFGTTNNKDRKLLAGMLHDTDGTFLKWAIDKIVHWNNQAIPKNLKHIHGTSDRILPIRFVNCGFKVRGGGHFMVVNKSGELSEKLKSLLY